jgi:glycosyltransferase involved in cell wall biosynthesis
MAGTLSGLNCDITIIGRKKKGECCSSDFVPFRTRRFRMVFNNGFLFYKFFNIRLFIYLLFHKYDLLVANDLDTLLPNYLVSKIKGLPLVYDSHEYFTGVPEIQNRPFVKWVWKSIEKSIFPQLRYVITVSDSIADKYENEYNIRPLTVRNCSLYSGHISRFSRDELGVANDHLLLIMQGNGINIDRGGEELIKAVSYIKKTFLLVVGSGDSLDKLKKSASDLNLSERVRFIDSVPWEELMRYTKSADIGLSLDKNSNQNYMYSLPNKLFDYLSAGIPVIAGDLPEVSGIISGNKCGTIISEVSPEMISEAVTELLNNPGKLSLLKKNAAIASEKLNWETESEKVKTLYEGVIKGIRV